MYGEKYMKLLDSIKCMIKNDVGPNQKTFLINKSFTKQAPNKSELKKNVDSMGK